MQCFGLLDLEPSWRHLPERFGNWISIWRSFNRWAKKGVWQRVFLELQELEMDRMFLDSTLIQANSDADGQKGSKKRKLLAVRMADLSTKSTLQSMGRGNPVEFRLSGGRASDIIQATELIDCHRTEKVIADKAYDRDDFVKTIELKVAKVAIHPKKNRHMAKLR